LAVTKAHINASKKYNAKTYKAFTVNAKIAEYEKISEYCEKNDVSKAQLLLRSALYCIDNDIDLRGNK
jgi:hypothetical protein